MNFTQIVRSIQTSSLKTSEELVRAFRLVSDHKTTLSPEEVMTLQLLASIHHYIANREKP